jgi:serine/threonine protein kinase
LKPENLLIGIDGHVKIADFGLSKPLTARKEMSHSFCGSPEYMAPEMLLKLEFILSQNWTQSHAGLLLSRRFAL